MQQDDSPAMVRTLLRYICTVDNDTDLNEYINQARVNNQSSLKEELMTIAEQLRKEGRQQGMQQGMQQALREDVLEILELRFYTIPYGIKEQLDTISDAGVLRKLHRLAVQAESIGAFTQGMPD